MKTTLQNNDSKWTLIANGKPIANGSTIRRNGVVSHFVTSEKNQQSEKKKKVEDDIVALKEIKKETQFRSYDHDEEKCPSMKVNTSSIKFANEALTTVIHQLKWRECKGNFKFGNKVADLYWHGAGFDEELYNMEGVYAVNKLPGMVGLSQKIHLSRIIKRMQTLFPGEYDFYPTTWFLPEQYHQFVAEASTKSRMKSDVTNTIAETSEIKLQKKGTSTYIVKPDCGSQGDGIYLVNNPRDVQNAVYGKPAIVQSYIDDPLLLDNFKFDLRMYVTIARINPLEVYLCKDGLARLCTVKYESPRSSNINNAFMHLTNYSLNKYSEDFLLTNAEHTGSKRTYRGVRHILQKRGYDVEKIHQRIVDLVVKTVLALIPDITIWNHVTNRSRCVRSFHILGFDILLTSDLKAHLLEVNSSPSMGIDTEKETEPGSGIFESVTSVVDEQIKVPLLRDVLRLVAYGEKKMDIEKSCLQRVYPATFSTNHSTSDAFVRDTKKQINCSSQNSNLSSPTSNHFSLKDEKKENDAKEDAMKLSKSVKNCRVDREKDVELVSKRDYFDNPLLHADLTSRQRYKPKNPKKFTVIKYRQEYAISTEEWKLFQLRSKVSSQLVALKNTATSSPNSLGHLTPRYRPKTPTTPKPNLVNSQPTKFFDDLCKICGHYLEGVGPGLYYIQKSYKNSSESNKFEMDTSQSDSGLKAGSYNNQASSELSSPKYFLAEWESESRGSQENALPPRSIYFDFAQQDESKNFFNRSQKQSSLSRCGDEEEEEEEERILKNVCDNCMEEANVASSLEDYKLNRGTLSLLLPRFQSNTRFILSQQRAEKRENFSIQDLLLTKRAADVFIFFNGIKPSLRISATSFRNMARKCHLCESGAMPAIDILFIDIMRQWQRQTNDHSSPFYNSYRQKNPITSHQPAGLPFQGFLEAIFRIAKARFNGRSLKEKLEILILNCEQYIKEAKRAANRKTKTRNDFYQKKDKVSTQFYAPRILCGLSTRQPYF